MDSWFPIALVVLAAVFLLFPQRSQSLATTIAGVAAVLAPTVGPIVSPLGNTLERGVGYTPYGDHFFVQCGMEVVLADGSLIRTGMGSVKGSTAWQAFKWGYGPYLDGIFTQSNFGVVTKLGFWLMPAPPVYKPFVVRHKRMEDVSKIVDAMRVVSMVVGPEHAVQPVNVVGQQLLPEVS